MNEILFLLNCGLWGYYIYWVCNVDAGRGAHVMTFEVGAVLEDAKWQVPSYCFDNNNNNKKSTSTATSTGNGSGDDDYAYAYAAFYKQQQITNNA